MTGCGCQCHGPYVWDVCPHCRPDLLGAAPRAEGLDARRFGTAIRNAGVNWTLGDVGKVLTEYARLSRPSDERVPESEEPR